MKMFKKSRKTRQKENRISWILGLKASLGTLDEMSHSAHCRAISCKKYFTKSISKWEKAGDMLGEAKVKSMNVVRDYIKTLDEVISLPFVKLLTRKQIRSVDRGKRQLAKWQRQAEYEARRDRALAQAA